MVELPKANPIKDQIDSRAARESPWEFNDELTESHIGKWTYFDMEPLPKPQSKAVPMEQQPEPVLKPPTPQQEMLPTPTKSMMKSLEARNAPKQLLNLNNQIDRAVIGSMQMDH